MIDHDSPAQQALAQVQAASDKSLEAVATAPAAPQTADATAAIDVGTDYSPWLELQVRRADCLEEVVQLRFNAPGQLESFLVSLQATARTALSEWQNAAPTPDSTLLPAPEPDFGPPCEVEIDAGRDLEGVTYATVFIDDNKADEHLVRYLTFASIDELREFVASGVQAFERARRAIQNGPHEGDPRR
jgi:hypothetical protein